MEDDPLGEAPSNAKNEGTVKAPTQTSTFDTPLPYTTKALKHLTDRGISQETARKYGVTQVMDESQLPPGAASYWTTEQYLPGLIFPWVSPDGVVVPQLHPDNKVIVTDETTGKVDIKKYVFAAGAAAPLWALRTVEDPRATLIVEGTCQAIVAAEHAPADVAVYGVAGCWNWSSNQLATADLKVVDGTDVVIMFDADVRSNSSVRDALVYLMDECELENAASVRWNTAGRGTNGLDDVLAGKPGREAVYLANLIEKADKKKPAKVDKATENARKREKRRAENTEYQQSLDLITGRPRFPVNIDKDLLADAMVNQMLRWDGDQLFSRGEVLTRRQDKKLEVVNKDHLGDLLGRLVRPGYEDVNTGDWCDQWPDMQSQGVALTRAHRVFSPLETLATTPLIREDGTVCAVNGYDRESKTFLLMTDDLAARVAVPQEPTAEDVQGAVKLLLHDWLVDFPFGSQEDRANILALLITPFIRSWSRIDVVPLAMLNGNGPSAGKGLMLTLLNILITGEFAVASNYPGRTGGEEEIRKQITATLLAGLGLVTWDEAHEICGAAMAQLLTAPTWADRVLGVSKIVYLPNRTTFVGAGNNVQVQADCARRYYDIRIMPTQENPENRPTSSFRHSDIKTWTHEHRAELVSAVLTLIRAWHTAGRPLGENWMGSFERWQEIVGGILLNAGVPGFLEGLRGRRRSVNTSGEDWSAHIEWLWSVFGERPFKCSEVARKLVQAGTDAHLPPGRQLALPEATAHYSQLLGKLYASRKDQWSNGLAIERIGLLDGYVQWGLVKRDEKVEEVEEVSPYDIEDEEGIKDEAHRTPPHQDTPEVDQWESVGVSGVSPATYTRKNSPLFHDQLREGTTTPYIGTTSTPLTPTDSHLRGYASVIDAMFDAAHVEAPPCEDCGGAVVAVEPHRAWYACPVCHPATARLVPAQRLSMTPKEKP